MSGRMSSVLYLCGRIRNSGEATKRPASATFGTGPRRHGDYTRTHPSSRWLPMRATTLMAWAACLLMATSAGAADRRVKPMFSDADLYADAQFAAPTMQIDAKQVFALDDAMHKYLGQEIGHELQLKGPRMGLFDALYTTGQLKLDYDAAMTRN